MIVTPENRRNFFAAKIMLIWLEKFREEEEVVLYPCKHYYNDNCINEWLRSKDSCPICKRDIRRGILKSLKFFLKITSPIITIFLKVSCSAIDFLL